MRIKDTFMNFLKCYISAGHTFDDDSLEELSKLTNEFIEKLHPDFYFTTFGICSYIAYLDDNMSETNRHFFKLWFNENRYVDFLGKWIKKILSENLTLRIVD